MGYTHYWKHSHKISPDIWAKIKTKAEKIVESVSTPLDEVQITDDMIWFNGVDEDSHEAFYFQRDGVGFEFCKTARKPYDLPVCLCLLAIMEEDPSVKVSSNGSWMDEWIEPRDKYKKLFGGYPPSWDRIHGSPFSH